LYEKRAQKTLMKLSPGVCLHFLNTASAIGYILDNIKSSCSIRNLLEIVVPEKSKVEFHSFGMFFQNVSKVALTFKRMKSILNYVTFFLMKTDLLN
jgi:hypothetical protein